MPPPEDEEEDYMSMVIEEPKQKETFTQKKRRQQREAEARAKVPSKAERAAEEAARRDAALMTNTLDPSNKGFQMMAKLGFKPGQTLGKQVPPPSDNPHGQDAAASARDDKRTEPLNLVFKEDRGGIGLDNEKKRKIKEEAEEAFKKVKHEEGDYRDRVRLERETRRAEAQFHAAQKVAERLDTEAEEGEGDNNDKDRGDDNNEEETDDKSDNQEKEKKPKKNVKPTSQINILYRGLVREREEKERSLHLRHVLQTSLPSSFFPNPELPGYDDPTLEREDREAIDPQARGEGYASSLLEQEVDEEDPELDEFNALEPQERLHKLVLHLREKHWYCFWCKCRYEDETMEGCPGLTEEDHD
ncbi:putative G-patch domain protein [Aspergillus glaucus CBS 516.65]|uniref:G-patch domain-containing protein n=1 Tax=Aspergillus glaucus CBS 516.65 TaxID=1160497 RepID=A0A1L9VYD1_ASPGL|nr:hypothetical protein ASPGLDRAFT_31986 [Aspergillus glaucus CBS 516.65]OJJ88889.1 hypothetical protein ASPGLDRAFT_31986 [Aspergillus glaucus CBS 516.65]